MGRPSELELRAASALLAPWRALTDPRFFGLEHVPRAGPMLLVGNHTVFGLVDLPPMLIGLFEASGVYARGLADHAHFKVPLWGEFLARFGAVDGTRENARRLLGDDEAVLVLPGGAREVTKRKGEAYTLIWKQRLGFARLAIERGCPVVPFGSVGAEESFDLLLDADSTAMRPVRAVLERIGLREDMIWPLARGIGPTALPRPERFYFSFGEPIETTRYGGRAEDGRAARGLRDRVKRAVEEQIDFCLDARERDPERDLVPRLAAQLTP